MKKKAWMQRGRNRVLLEPYCFETDKVRKETGRVRLHVISDYHGAMTEEEQTVLTRRIRSRHPDMILLPGDCITRKSPETLENAHSLLKGLAAICPVFYAPGNHETGMEEDGDLTPAFRSFRESLEELGVRYLSNAGTELEIRGSRFWIEGLELGLEFYKKPRSAKMKQDYLEDRLEHPGEQVYEIVLAHSPKYGKNYLEWGADLTLCGHYHGGVMRFGRRRGLISPQFRMFPPFCCGDFSGGTSRMVVSAGMGEHSVPIRIRNPRVLLEIDLVPLEK